MTIVSSGLLETYTPSVSTQADQNIINQKVADNIESLRRFGIGIGDVTSLHSHTAITADNFTLYKKAGFISFYQFNSSTGNIDGVFDGATLAEGDQFLLVNKASTPSTNTVTLALGSYSLLGSSDTSIVLNSNSVYVYLVYIGSDKFIRVTHNTDILEQNNTWAGENSFNDSIIIPSKTGVAKFDGSNKLQGSATLNDVAGPVSLYNFNNQKLDNVQRVQIFSADFSTGDLNLNGDTIITKRNFYVSTTDNKTWRDYTDDGHFYMQAVNDAYTSFTTYFQVNRTGTTIDKILIPASPLELSNDLKFTTDGVSNVGTPSVAADEMCAYTFTTVSDERKKRNIQALPPKFGTPFIRALRGAIKQYKWKNNNIAEKFITEKNQKTTKKIIDDFEIVNIDGKYIKKAVKKESLEPVFEIVNLYDENNNVIGNHQIPVYEEIERKIPARNQDHKRVQNGFLAQLIETAFKAIGLDKKDFPGLLAIDENGNYTLRQEQFNPTFVLTLNEILDRLDIIESQLNA